MSSCHIDASLQDQYTLNCSLFRSAKPLKWNVKGYWNIKNHLAWWIFSKHCKRKWQKGKTNRMCCMYLAYFPISQVVSDTRPINWLGEMWPECRYWIEEIVYQYSNEHLKLKSNKNKITEKVITEESLVPKIIWCVEGDTHKPPVVWIKRYFWSFGRQHIA